MAQNNVLIHPDAVQSIKVDLTETAEANQPYLAHGLHGVLLQDGDSGDIVAMDVSQRTWQINVGSLTAAKGDILYIDASGDLTNTDTDRTFGYVVAAKDSNNVADVLIAPQEV